MIFMVHWASYFSLSLIMNDALMTLFAFVITLVPLVFFHELGHYLAARACGVHIESFSIGFGPKLLGWTDKSGTQWKISLLLLGGYVKIMSEADGTNPHVMDRSRTLEGKSSLQRIAIAISGPFMNYAIAFFLLLGLFTQVGKLDYLPVVGSVKHQSVGERYRLSGKKITSIQGQPISLFSDIPQILAQLPAGHHLDIGIQEEVAHIEIPSQSVQGTWLGKLGVGPDLRTGFYEKRSIKQAVSDIGSMMNPLRMVKSLSVDNMSGPIGIGRQAGAVLSQGVVPFLFFVATISIALGFFNMLPLPTLDGGMILISCVEGIIRRKISKKIITAVSMISFAFLISSFIWMSWKDICAIPAIRAVLEKTKLALGPIVLPAFEKVTALIATFYG